MQSKKLILVLFLSIACSSQPQNFNGERAYEFLKQQCDLGPRFPGAPGHQALRSRLIEFLKPLADSLVVQDFDRRIEIEKKTLHLTNIVAGFGIGRGNGLLIGAHWDTRIRAEQDPDPAKVNQPILGANDGASGVAVLMHLAEILSKTMPEREVWLVFFDGEDYGFPGALELYCLGSEHFAKNLPIPRPTEAIVIDMIGDAELEIPVERNSINSHPILIRKLLFIAGKRGYREFKSYIGDEIYDDHLMLIRHAEIPSVDLIDFEYPNRYNNYWHTTQDTPDKCSPRSLKIVGTVLSDYIYRMDAK